MTGQLFIQYFLTDGIRATPEWRASVSRPGAFAAFRDGLRGVFETFGRFTRPNESVTEQDLIRPVLALLGWTDSLPQQGTARNEDVPDHLLFADAWAKARAAARPTSDERYRDALLVEESKRFGHPLDRRDRDDTVQGSTPHGQILRYLSTAETVSDGCIRWGILTDGGVWRLYDQCARPRASGYFEVDLRALLSQGDDGLRTFHLLFRREAFVLRQGATTTFLEHALSEGRRYEKQVAQDLSDVVFGSVFPALVDALARHASKDLSEIRDAARIRRDILDRAHAANWTIDPAQLTDQAIIRRMVLKRCIYGVDKDRLTVELAKVSLWLHSFTVGAPLSFLDHHLRCGDSLVGLRVGETRAELERLGSLFASSAIQGAETAAAGMQRIEELSDADVAEVRASASLFREVENTTADLCGLRWLTAGMTRRNLAAREAPVVEALEAARASEAYTAHDMAPLARDLRYDGPPFVWNAEERRHLRTRLDTLYFHIYGLSREDAGDILDTFPIVRRDDEAAFDRYRTRDLVLAYMNALTAGDTETLVTA